MKFLLLLLFITISAFAELNYNVGDWSSGGGNAIICFKTPEIAKSVRNRENKEIKNSDLMYIISIEMYDLYEAKLLSSRFDESLLLLKLEDESLTDYINRLSE